MSFTVDRQSGSIFSECRGAGAGDTRGGREGDGGRGGRLTRVKPQCIVCVAQTTDKR